MKQQFDRGAICRRAHALKRERGIPFGDAMRAAWAEAKGNALPMARSSAAEVRTFTPNLCAQAGGIQATLQRYGLTADRMERLAGRAVAVIRDLVEVAETKLLTAIARKEANIAALQDGRDVMTLRRNEDGSYSL